MNNDDHLLTLKIDAYIKGQLSHVEQKAFEQDLKTDAVLVERLRMQRAELALLEMIAEEDLRLKVRKWSAEIEGDADKPSRKWWQHLLPIFAVLSGILALFYFFILKKMPTDIPLQVLPNTENKDTQESTPIKTTPFQQIDTIKKIDSPIQNPKRDIQNPKQPIATVEQMLVRNDLLADVEGIERSAERGNDTMPPLSKAVQFIQNQNFISAQSLLISINQQSVNYADAQFLLATIDYLQKKPKRAAATFKILSAMDGYIHKEQAVYYWAASLIADGQITEAKKILTQIAAEVEHPKHDAAIALLKLL